MTSGPKLGTQADYRRFVASEPENAEYWRLLGIASFEAGDLKESRFALRRAVALAPRSASAQHTRAVVEAAAGRVGSAVAGMKQALRLEPDNAGRLRSLGVLLARAGRITEAVDCYEQLAAAPEGCDPQVRIEMARLMRRAGLAERAAAEFEALATEGRQSGDIWNGLAASLIAARQYGRAVDVCRNALESRPLDSALHTNFGAALAWCGRVPEAIAALGRGLALNPTNANLISNYLSALNYPSGVAPSFIFEEHRRHTASLAPAEGGAAKERKPRKRGRRRIAYVSPDLRNHVVSFFIEPVLAAHDRERIEVICYSDAPASDLRTQRLRGYTDRWRDTYGMADLDLIDLIRRDGIDVLIDLAGHSANNRLGIFAQRAAPLQISYLGYPNTTGLSQMDLRVTDSIADPPGADAFNTERLARVPGCLFAYAPQAAIYPLPERPEGPFTFASFNQLFKISDATLLAWAEILRGAPDARLLIVARSLSDPGVAAGFRQRCERGGVDPRALELQGFLTDSSEHLRRLMSVDLMLDTFPYNGVTTTCEALWMGTPVLVMRGDTHPCRLGASICEAAGFDEYIANSPDEYVRIALSAYGRRAIQPAIRARIRERIVASPLSNGTALARALEEIYCAGWQPSGDQPAMAMQSIST